MCDTIVQIKLLSSFVVAVVAVAVVVVLEYI